MKSLEFIILKTFIDLRLCPVHEQSEVEQPLPSKVEDLGLTALESGLAMQHF